ncbi:hypothetical protein [Actinomadura sp. KC345]|uniref:TlpA family protein disulfide reductase n=1 Tax=Actinomadura sp. KC345 TaxID=2530371 RepID=UPI0014055B6B|nr:hypothetical protein [Actinomadura sp. KC345]
MTVLIAAVVILACLGLLILLVLLGVTRRLRDHTERLHRLERGRPLAGPSPADFDVGEFSATSLDGEPMSADWLVGEESVVAFLTYGCSACSLQLPALRRHTAETGGKVLIVAALVPGEEADPAALRAEVGDGAVIVEERFAGPIQRAFQVEEYPTFHLVGADGAPRALSAGLRDLLDAREDLPAGVPAG